MLWTLLLCMLAPPAMAQDDLLDDGGETDEPVPPRPDDAPMDLLEDDEEELDLLEGDEAIGEDLLGDDEEAVVHTGPGVDTADIYRQYQQKVRPLGPDEAVIAWEQYLEMYPRTMFRERINKEIDELMASLYGDRLDRDEGYVDAGSREIEIAQGLMLEPLNPRTRAQAGFEWGLPDYMNLFADYEHSFMRQLSAHAGVRRRFSGWSIEGGPRYALIKAARTQTILTVIGDLRLNADPAFFGFRPQLAFGFRAGDVDIQMQGGVDLDTRPNAGLPLVGGFNGTYNATDNVGVFAETSVYMKFVGSTLGTLPYRFNTASFGLKFYPVEQDEGRLEVNVGASVPYTFNYWMFHFGSIVTQVNYFL